MPLTLESVESTTEKLKRFRKSDLYGVFYNPIKVLSYGKFIIFSIGSRSIGKSTGWAIFLLTEFIDKGRQFIYVRRTQDETQLTAPTYFDNAANILIENGAPIKEVVYKGGVYFVDGKVAGYAIPLSLQQKYKSSNYSDVWYILYDEFMVMPGSTSGYLGGRTNSSAEVDAMSSLYQTVDRGIGRASRNETKIIFVGNAGAYFNPFFINYHIDRYLRPDTKYLSPKNDIYVLEQTSETGATKTIKESNGYKMSTEKTRQYAYENKYADLGASAFIEKFEGRKLPLCNFSYEGDLYGLYRCNEAGFLYVCHKTCDGRQTIALTTADHDPNYLMINTWHGHPITKLLKEMYDMGCVRFSDHKCKMVIDFYLRYDIM